MRSKFFIIEALSNLHVGSGEINYGLIDNLIQRDSITELPNINSSSLKGALREYFKRLEEKGKNKDCDGKVLWTVTDIFGSDPKEDDLSKRKQGSVRFFEAELLSIPIRCDDKPYEMVTSGEILKGLKEKLDAFGCFTSDEDILRKKLNSTIRKIKKNEDRKNGLNALAPLFGAPLRDIDHADFKQKCSDEELPVISRNNLENGQSANLWYEQVLPKRSRLGFICLGKDKNPVKDGIDYFEEFSKELGKAQLQIGANATIGYGYCKIMDIQSLNFNENQQDEED